MSFTLFESKFDDENYPSKSSMAEISNEESIIESLKREYLLDQEPHILYAFNLYKTNSPRGMKGETFSIWSATYFLFVLRAFNYEKDHEEEFKEILERTRKYLEERKCVGGGFSGFNYDHPHLVTNYSLIMSIALIGTEEAYNIIDRAAMYKFIMSLKCENGSFRTTLDMENDIRSTFTAILIAYTLNMLTPEITQGVSDYVLSCRRYDGGYGPEPGIESHGGYVHCAVGIMKILGELDKLDLNSLIRWISMRQMEFSGGFQGRTNKLVDSCYSWWVGSAARIISDHLGIPPFWNDEGITEYTLRSSQRDYGFRDHAPSQPDPFHTFFGLAGLCVCGNLKDHGAEVLPEIDTLFCVPKDLANKMRDYFLARPFDPSKEV